MMTICMSSFFILELEINELVIVEYTEEQDTDDLKSHR